MKKLVWFLAALGAVTLAAVTGAASHDASELVPVQALVIDAQNGMVTLTADTGDTGRGANLDAAFADLRAGCAGTLFTQTAEHILLKQKAWYLAPQVSVNTQLRPAAKLYRVIGDNVSAEQALSFLQAHPGRLSLSQMRAALLENRQVQTPQLVVTGGGLRLGG